MPENDVLTKVKADLADVKKVAGEHSANVHRLRMELGAAQDRSAELKAELEELKSVRDSLAAAETRIRFLEKQYEKAMTAVAEGGQAILAAKAISENLAKLQSL